jgi:hypothetical protein
MSMKISHAQPTDGTTFPLDADDCGPLRFERRREDRWTLDGVATAFEVAGVDFGRTHTLRMHDYSHAGMGAFSDSPVMPGTTVSIGFQAPGYPARRGTVHRCEPCGNGYRVAICFEQRLAA